MGSALANCRPTMLYLSWIWAFLLNHFFGLCSLVSLARFELAFLCHFIIGNWWSGPKDTSLLCKIESGGRQIYFCVWHFGKLIKLLLGNWHKVVCFSLFAWVVQWADGITSPRHLKIGLKSLNEVWWKQTQITQNWDIFLARVLIYLILF